ncbi:MAG: 2Fe-2S iron-sulfur cluster-binding protein [Bacteroidia bacterium]|nr:2Fe-2S iron-sulfur cluster-binding protein [Bacteroidia bacterium]
MAVINFITQEGEKISVEGTSGSIMELATSVGIAGLDGDCGGVCSCATCHVYVNETYRKIVGEAEKIEKEMLEFDELAKENSRLSCQIEISEKLDGIELIVARE